MLIFVAEDTSGLELWLPAYNSHIDILDTTIQGQFLQSSSIKCTNKFTPQDQKSPSVSEPHHKSSSSSPINTPSSLQAGSGSSSRTPSATRLPKINMLCCCIIEQSLWIGDASGTLHSYSLVDYSHIFSYMLDPAIKSPLITLVYLRDIQRVAVGLHNGRVFLVDSSRVPSNCAFAEGSFVLTEICSGLILHCACAVMIEG